MGKRQSTFRGSPRHLAVLADSIEKQDASIWNSFLEQNGPDFHPKLAGADFSEFFMKDVNLCGADLSESLFEDTTLTRVDFSNANLHEANFSNATLIETSLEGANLSQARLWRASLVRVQIKDANFQSANLSESLWNGTDPSQADMNGADTTGSSLEEVRRDNNRESQPEEIPRKNWKEALADEEKMRISRGKRAEEKEQEKERLLNKRLGRRKPFFKKM